jgi:hypothetical protein
MPPARVWGRRDVLLTPCHLPIEQPRSLKVAFPLVRRSDALIGAYADS